MFGKIGIQTQLNGPPEARSTPSRHFGGPLKSRTTNPIPSTQNRHRKSNYQQNPPHGGLTLQTTHAFQPSTGWFERVERFKNLPWVVLRVVYAYMRNDPWCSWSNRRARAPGRQACPNTLLASREASNRRPPGLIESPVRHAQRPLNGCERTLSF